MASLMQHHILSPSNCSLNTLFIGVCIVTSFIWPFELKHWAGYYSLFFLLNHVLMTNTIFSGRIWNNWVLLWKVLLDYWLWLLIQYVFICTAVCRGQILLLEQSLMVLETSLIGGLMTLLFRVLMNVRYIYLHIVD